MKALTIRQPWASLIALGVKTIETRSWSTSYRGPLAIHAAKRRPSPWWEDTRTGYAGPNRQGAPWHDQLERFCEYGETDYGHYWAWVDQSKYLGAVVATCELVEVVPTDDLYSPTAAEPDRMWQRRMTSIPLADWDIEANLPYGDYARGRFAWLLADIKPLNVPVPAKGRQGLWTVSVPA